MTFDELTKLTLSVFPDAELGHDNDGQVVIYTGLRITSDENVVPM